MALIAAVRARIGRLLADISGTTAIEYAVIASMVSIAIMGAVTALGVDLQTVFYNKLAGLFP
jgi:pilus assembly protein Flp/PilA